MYFIHEWRAEAKVVRINTRELDGRPGKEILVYRLVKPRPDDTEVEILEIYGLYKGNLRRRFSQIVGVNFGAGSSAHSPVKFEKKGKRPAVIVVPPATVQGLTQANFRAPDPTESIKANPLLLPWTDKRSRYRLRGVEWSR